MRRSVRWTGTFFAALALSFSGCVDRPMPMGPEDSSESLAPFFSVEPAPGFDVLRRSNPLEKDITRSRVIGPGGGSIRIKKAGVTLEIPKGALSSPTRIAVTATAGDAVAFTFEPHGLSFSQSATIRVDPKGTPAEDALHRLLEGHGDDDPVRLGAFLGVYFSGTTRGDAVPLEVMETFLQEGEIIFRISHFSGYAVAGG